MEQAVSTTTTRQSTITSSQISSSPTTANATLTTTTTSTTTSTSTTTTRAPSECELDRDGLIVFNPQNIHIATCMVTDGAYKPDQYETSGISYCVDVNGNTIRGTLQILDSIEIQNEARFEECMDLRE